MKQSANPKSRFILHTFEATANPTCRVGCRSKPLSMTTSKNSGFHATLSLARLGRIKLQYQFCRQSAVGVAGNDDPAASFIYPNWQNGGNGGED